MTKKQKEKLIKLAEINKDIYATILKQDDQDDLIILASMYMIAVKNILINNIGKDRTITSLKNIIKEIEKV